MNANAWTTCLLPILVSGCVGLSRDPPQKHRYLLQATRPANAPASSADGARPVLQVRPFQLATPVASRSFVYRTGPNAYETDYYHEFLGSPTDNLAAVTRAWLEQSGLFAAIIDGATRLNATHELEVDVTTLHGDYATPKPAAVLGVKVMVLREADGQIAFHKRYDEREPLANREPDVLVEGWNQALARVLGKLEADLRASLQ